jgi:hypothetical protein
MNQNIFVLVPIGAFLLLGLGTIGWSISIHRRGLPGSPEEWRKDLIHWRILGPNTLPQTLVDVKRCRDYLLSTTALAGGIGIVLAMIGWTIITLMATDTLVTANTSSNAFFLASAFLSVSIGFGIGAVVAARRLRNAAQQRVTYADLRQRRLSDYRSNAFRWLAIAMIVWTFGVFALFAPHAGPTLQIDLLSIVVSVPNTVWGWCIVPGTMLLVFVLVEIVLFRIVGFSRLLVTSDTTVAQHADDMLRAIVIGSVLYCELLALGQLAALPSYILTPLLWASHYWQIGHLPYFGLLSINLFMPVVMQVLGIGIILGRGRLGGKLSGWPWRVRQIKQLEGGQ